MIRLICIAGAFVLLTGCGEIPSCNEIDCQHPQGAYEFDGIFVPVDRPMPSGDTTAAGAARG